MKQKVVLRLDVHDDKCKRNAMQIVSSLYGVDSVSMDMKEKKLTLTGDFDPVLVVSKLRKVYMTEIVSVGPAKDESKKEENAKKKDGPQKATQVRYYTPAPHSSYYNLPPVRSYAPLSEENPNACAIC